MEASRRVCPTGMMREPWIGPSPQLGVLQMPISRADIKSAPGDGNCLFHSLIRSYNECVKKDPRLKARTNDVAKMLWDGDTSDAWFTSPDDVSLRRLLARAVHENWDEMYANPQFKQYLLSVARNNTVFDRNLTDSAADSNAVKAAYYQRMSQGTDEWGGAAEVDAAAEVFGVLIEQWKIDPTNPNDNPPKPATTMGRVAEFTPGITGFHEPIKGWVWHWRILNTCKLVNEMDHRGNMQLREKGHHFEWMTPMMTLNPEDPVVAQSPKEHESVLENAANTYRTFVGRLSAISPKEMVVKFYRMVSSRPVMDFGAFSEWFLTNFSNIAMGTYVVLAFYAFYKHVQFVQNLPKDEPEQTWWEAFMEAFWSDPTKYWNSDTQDQILWGELNVFKPPKLKTDAAAFKETDKSLVDSKKWVAPEQRQSDCLYQALVELAFIEKRRNAELKQRMDKIINELTEGRHSAFGLDTALLREIVAVYFEQHYEERYGGAANSFTVHMSNALGVGSDRHDDLKALYLEYIKRGSGPITDVELDIVSELFGITINAYFIALDEGEYKLDLDIETIFTPTDGSSLATWSVFRTQEGGNACYYTNPFEDIAVTVDALNGGTAPDAAPPALTKAMKSAELLVAQQPKDVQQAFTQALQTGGPTLSPQAFMDFMKSFVSDKRVMAMSLLAVLFMAYQVYMSMDTKPGAVAEPDGFDRKALKQWMRDAQIYMPLKFDKQDKAYSGNNRNSVVDEVFAKAEARTLRLAQ